MFPQLFGGSKVYLFSYENTEQAMAGGSVVVRSAAEAQEADSQIPCQGVPRLSQPKGSGTSKVQLTGFISYLHFP